MRVGGTGRATLINLLRSIDAGGGSDKWKCIDPAKKQLEDMAGPLLGTPIRVGLAVTAAGGPLGRPATNGG
jgi:hypothetical protein